MMKRAEITKKISKIIENELFGTDPRIYWAKEVTFDYSTNHAVRVDYMRIKPVNNFVSGIERSDVFCYEVKSSVADFHSKHGHNVYVGDYNYYVMPRSVYEKVAECIPWGVGVYTVDDSYLENPEKDYFIGIKPIMCEKNARRHNRKRPVSEILLMMFRSRHRDALKNSVE